MQEHIRFPSIEQFRNVIQKVKHKTRFIGVDEAGEPIYNRTKDLPTLVFEGTVKLHGTNAAVVDKYGMDLYFQSRERVLSIERDNNGFAFWATAHLQELEHLKEEIRKYAEFFNQEENVDVIIYGEWCGGSIQPGVAISGLKKMFVVFKVKIGDTWYSPASFPTLETNPEAGIYFINRFHTFKTSINFESPESIQNTLIGITMLVEEQCPVGKAFGVEGTGEGVVWSCVTPGWESSDFVFKVKGEKHSSSKVKTLAEVDVEKINSIASFVDKCVTENRLVQGLCVMRELNLPFTVKSTGDFVRWVYKDILKEELDTITESNLEPKELGGAISNKARKWYFSYLDEIAND